MTDGSEKPLLMQPDQETRINIAAVSSLLSQDLPTVEAGQIWRASWNEDTFLCLVLSIEQDYWVDVAPVLLEDDVGDRFTLDCSADLSPLRCRFSVFAGLALPLRTFVLDFFIGPVDSSVLHAAIQLKRNNDRGESPDSLLFTDGMKTGSLDAGDFDERRELRIEISQAFSRLASVELISESHNDHASLHDIVRSAGIQLSDVADHLAASISETRSLLTGARPPSSEELVTMAQIPGLHLSDLERAMPSIPPGLSRAANRPSVSRAIRIEAKRIGLPPSVVLRSIPARAATRKQATGSPSSESVDESFWADTVVNILSRSE